MINNVFAGMPNEHIKNVVLKRYESQKPWDLLALKLEYFTNDMIGKSLPAVGSEISVKYKVDAEGDFVDTPWQVLGYNGSIPEYVKYKNGNNRIFVRSVEENQNSENYQLLKASFKNSQVYNRLNNGTYELIVGKNVRGVGSETFTYGNNCTYTVPKSITVNGTTYTFAGYNMTLAPKYLLPVKNNGVVLYHQQFDSGRGYNSAGQNDWSTSMSRTWLNDSWTAIQDRCANQGWYDSEHNSEEAQHQTCAIKGMIDRVETGSWSFFAHVMPTVNRTWTFKLNSAVDGSQYDFRYRKDKSGNNITSDSDEYDITKAAANGLKYLDGNQCEHCIDKFWLLGVGNVNCSGADTDELTEDEQYDTTKYNEIFNETDMFVDDQSRVKMLMDEDGQEMQITGDWRLRSAAALIDSTEFCNIACFVEYSYGVGCSTVNANSTGALLPACTIC